MLQPAHTPPLHFADRMLALVEVMLRQASATDSAGAEALRQERFTLDAEVDELRAANHLPEDQLAETFGLSRLELDVVWLTVAPWLEPQLRNWIARLNANLLHDFVDPGLVVRLLCTTRIERLAAHSIFDADGALIASGLLGTAPRDVAPNNPMHHELVPADHLVGFLRGSDALSRALAGVARRVEPSVTVESLSLSRAVDERVLPLVRGFFAGDDLDGPLFGPGGMDFPRGVGFVLMGPSGSGRTLSMKAVAGTLNRAIIEVHGERLAQMSLGGGGARLRLICQEAELRGDVVAVRHGEQLLSQQSGLAPYLSEALARHRVVVGFVVEDPVRLHGSLGGRILDRIALPRGESSLEPVWRANLPAIAEGEGIDTGTLSTRLNLTGGQIRNAARLTGLLVRGQGDEKINVRTLEASALSQLGSDMGHLARVTSDERALSDLILEDETREQILEIIAAIDNRHHIMKQWGLKAKLRRGIGICCLFDGEPGTGKTLAAEVVTSAVGLRLFRVNVPSVVDKYIGETEKNLSRIFERARPDTTVLLFDEADSLFSKRTEVSRSTDRYSNMEINVLLQLIEQYEGVTVLTTNLKQSMDQAFERRITFKVNFPMPEEEQRVKIWRYLLPDELPKSDDIIYEHLAEMELSGGEIKNAIVRAAYAAAQDDCAVGMDHLFDAAMREASAAGRLVREFYDD